MTDATICTHGTGYMETNFRLSLKEDGITYADHDRWMRLRLGCQAREVRSDGSVEFCGSHGSWGRIKSVDLGDDESLQLCERHWDALREWFHEDLERREQHLEAWTENVVRKEQEQRQRLLLILFNDERTAQFNRNIENGSEFPAYFKKAGNVKPLHS